ncbi:probable protein phosphatase 2C 21, partial [Aphidius gifuensis]|uniref:probable protein phosphatase 2C 21 n=1 Tax=Aphidius gifuensis TaxID=684658 RepID=UPI001CDBE4F5
MGSYLSKPITKKISTHGIGKNVVFGASSMQGWRKSQEDAHNCCINFDHNASLFAVYDGHSGHEVAQYCSQKLPEFIKETDAYKRGDVRQALIDAFLGFDATLKKPEIIKILKKIAKTKVSDTEIAETCDSDKVSHLGMKAEIPLEQLIGQYRPKSDESKKKRCSKKNISNSYFRCRKAKDKNPSCSGSSSSWETSKADKKEELPDSSGDVNEQVSSKIKADINGEDKSSCDINDDDDDDDDEAQNNSSLEPGSKSGCTAIVALLHGENLYVANAGDSRCVLCRDGKALELSLDHKPKDTEEMKRIERAGGEVTWQGRVNGNLNLSRAIGDHQYKQNTELPPEDQMISALPDIRHILIDPKRDEFLILACDGIWNSMSSSEVVKFVKKKINDAGDNISKVCEELFDHCLAPDTRGAQLGCDNMTTIIVKFKNSTLIP